MLPGPDVHLQPESTCLDQETTRPALAGGRWREEGAREQDQETADRRRHEADEDDGRGKRGPTAEMPATGRLGA